MSSFQDLGFFVHNNPEPEAPWSYAYALFLYCNSRTRAQRVTPLGFCLGVIVNEKHLNLEKTTSSALLVIF